MNYCRPALAPRRLVLRSGQVSASWEAEARWARRAALSLDRTKKSSLQRAAAGAAAGAGAAARRRGLPAPAH